jgi:hypothetical protein
MHQAFRIGFEKTSAPFGFKGMFDNLHKDIYQKFNDDLIQPIKLVATGLGAGAVGGGLAGYAASNNNKWQDAAIGAGVGAAIGSGAGALSAIPNIRSKITEIPKMLGGGTIKVRKPVEDMQYVVTGIGSAGLGGGGVWLYNKYKQEQDPYRKIDPKRTTA